MSDVMVAFRKYDGSLHWNFKLQLLGEDEHGVWLGMPEGTVARRGHNHRHVEEKNSALLIPTDQWWTAHFNESGELAVYCDVATVPEWRGSEVTMVDLDLDVIRLRDGKIYTDDEDEFAEHQVKYGYPPEIVKGAEAAADYLMTAVADGKGPFGGAHEPWLAQVS